MDRYYNGETARIRATLITGKQLGDTGETVTLRIKRRSDSFYWNGSAFQLSPVTVNMLEEDAVNLPGRYYYDLALTNTEVFCRAVTAGVSAIWKEFDGTLIFAAPPSSGSTGANTVTLTVQAPAATPQPGARVTVKNSTETSTLDVKIADALGQVQVLLDDATYKAIITKPGVATWSTTSVVVSGTTGQTIVGALIAPVPPPSPGSCSVFIYPSVAAVANAVYFSALPGQVVANVMLDATPIVATVVSDVTDYYRADLVHGGQYQVSSFRFVFADSQFVVPALASCNLKDYLKDLREI